MKYCPIESARHHVAKGERIVAEQENRIRLKRQRGQETALSEDLLSTFRRTLVVLKEDLDRFEFQRADMRRRCSCGRLHGAKWPV